MKQQEDILITCVDCKKGFDFTVGEQEFYKEKEYSKPKRCKSCRAARKASADSGKPPVVHHY